MRTRLPILYLVVLAVLSRPSLGSSETAVERIQSLIQRDALDSAMVVADSALTADSANLQLMLIKADIYAARMDRAGQLRTLRELVSRSPMYTDALMGLARLYVDSGLADSAFRFIKPHLLRGGPNQVEALYLKGRSFEAKGLPDSAVASYERAYEIVDTKTLLRFPPQRVQRLNQANLISSDGDSSIWRLGIPTIFIFWADWSPISVAALGDIVEHLKGAGISWRFVPVNVESPNPDPEAVAQLVSRARDLGYKDTVWVDRDLSLFRKWNIQHVPTVIVANINGDIDAVLSGWSETARSTIVDRYLGKYTDEVAESAATTSGARTRARYLLASASLAGNNGNLEQAVKRADKAVAADSTFAVAHVSLAAWRWVRGDTLGARLAAHKALAADPNDLWAMLAVARIDYLRGHFQSALGNARQCTVVDSGFVPGWELLGFCATALGDRSLAQTAIDAITRFNKLDLELPVLRARLIAATDPAEAAKLLRNVLAARL